MKPEYPSRIIMAEIQIRSAIASDIAAITQMEHNYETDFVLQMDIHNSRDQIHNTATFRRVRLPRTQRVEYPRHPKTLLNDWTNRSGLLVASLQENTIGYVSLSLNVAPGTAWVTDLVVDRQLRRKGVGTTLLLSSLEWGANHACRMLALEMQLKNDPAIRMAQKYGFDFIGFNDRYYSNHDAVVFFGKSLQ